MGDFLALGNDRDPLNALEEVNRSPKNTLPPHVGPPNIQGVSSPSEDLERVVHV